MMKPPNRLDGLEGVRSRQGLAVAVLAGATHGRPRPIVGGHGMHQVNLLRKSSGGRVGNTGPGQRGTHHNPEPSVAH